MLLNIVMVERREYKVCNLSVTERTPEELLSGSYNEDILRRFEMIIEVEAPIREQLLFKRAIRSYGLEKVGSRLLQLFRSIEGNISYPYTNEGTEKVFHRKNDEERFFRPTPESEIRYSYQIPYSEAANAIIAILEKDNRSLYKKDIAAIFLKEMGWERTGAKVKELIDNALKDPRIHRTGNGRFFIK